MRIRIPRSTLAALLLLSTFNLQLSTLFAQGTAFTYQGRLNDGPAPANGLYDLNFSVFSVTNGGSPLAGPLTNSAVTVSNGLFTTLLDFGAAAFPGEERWLEIQVRVAPDAFTTLSPRQKITATPYALTARNVTGVVPGTGLAGTYDAAMTFNNVGNSFTGNGAGLANVNAATLGGLSGSDFWRTTGNNGTTAGTHFLGTTDNQPLEIKVNGLRALRIEDNGDSLADFGIIPDGAPNLIGGSPRNFVGAGVVGATIGGGGATNYFGSAYTNSVLADFGVLGGGLGNTIGTDSASSVIGGGEDNTIGINSLRSAIGGGQHNSVAANSTHATIAGGVFNQIGTGSVSSVIGGGEINTVAANSFTATIVGGFFNQIGTNSDSSFIGGGQENTIGSNSERATVGGGLVNTIEANAAFATIPGGLFNSIGTGASSAFAAGRQAKANHRGAFVWADSTGVDFASTANNQFLIRAAGGVGIGTTTPITSLHIAAAEPAMVLQDTGPASTQTGYISFRNANLTETAWVGFGTAGSPDFTIRNARSFGNIVLSPSLVSGNVGIGRSPAANALEVEGNASKTAAGSWLANSDARIKTDVRTVTGALDKLAQVRLVQFHYTDDYRAQHPSLKDRSYLNVVAQEFQKVFPEDVQSSGEKLPGGDAILQVDTYPLTIYSAAAIQELNRKLTDELKRRDAENAELNRRLERLEQRLNKQTRNER